MKKKKMMEGHGDFRYGGVTSPSTLQSTVHEREILEQVSTHTTENSFFVVLRTLFTAFLSLILAILLVVFVLLIFIKALSENVIIPDIGPVSSIWLVRFFESRYSLIFGSTLAMIPLIIIILLNTYRVRNVFFAVGCSMIISSILSIVMAIFRIRIFKILSGEWQDILVNVTMVFRDFCNICAAIMITIGITCLSIYSCIVIIKGGRHEKEN